MNCLRCFRNIFFALAAFLWLPASAHCQLETVSGLDFFRCSADTTADHSPCQDDGCSSLEKSQFHSTQLRLTLSTPDLLPVSVTPVSALVKTLPAEVSVGILTAAPPQFLSARHFLARTALPVRAPSLAS